MKKLFISAAAILLCFLAHSQEADGDRQAVVSFVPRVDLSPAFSTNGSGNSLSYGNSSFYIYFEGNASEHFSWTVATHWLQYSKGEYQNWLYDNLGRSDSNNFLDFCNVGLNFGKWNFTIGKDCIATGGFEFTEWDHEVHTEMATPFWNDFGAYQWGFKAGRECFKGTTTLSVQMMTSPFGERPFASGLYSYTANWSGEYGPFSNIYSISAVEYAKGCFDALAYLGSRLTLGDYIMTLNWTNNYGCGDVADKYHLVKGNTFQFGVNKTFTNWFDCGLKGLYAMPKDNAFANPFWKAGVIAHFYPLKENKDLRLHATVNYDSKVSNVVVNIGAFFNIHTPNLFKK